MRNARKNKKNIDQKDRNLEVHKKEEKREIYRKETKNSKFKNYIKVMSVCILIFIFAIFLSIISIIEYTNIQIHNQVEKSKDKKVYIEDKLNLNKIYIFNNTKKYLKDIKKEIYIKSNISYVKLDLNNMKNIIDLSNKVVVKKSTYIYFKDLKTINVDINSSTLKAIDKITIDISKEYKNKKYVDSYVLDKNKKYISYIKNLEIINGKVEVPLIKDKKHIKSFILVNVELKEIKFADTLELLKSSKTDLNIEYVPNNATIESTNIISDNENVVKIIDGKIEACEIGNANLKVKVNNIEKIIPVVVYQNAERIDVKSSKINLYVDKTYTIKATIYPENSKNGELEYISSDEKICTVKDNVVKGIAEGKAEITIKTKTEPIIENKITVTVKENATVSNESSKDGLTYINGILIANKKYGLPSTYNPGVNSTAKAALTKLQNAASSKGYSLPLKSGFRSYSTQVATYNGHVKRLGQTQADLVSAKPGHSEHQTGLAFDIGYLEYSFGDTPAGKWLAQNAHTYGFIIRYPKGKTGKTGYDYEPWHVRYLGVDTATKVHNSGLCLEEYLGI